MPKYLDSFPKPLLADIVDSKCIPIIGAGFSLNAEVPDGQRMPTWKGLADALATELPEYPSASPVDIISAFVYEFRKSKLVERLHDLLLVDRAKPGPAHKAFCDCYFDLVVTTNFEFLLEDGYAEVKKSCLPILDEDQLAVAPPREVHVKLVKLHGDLHHPGRLIATEDDYDSFLRRYPLLATYLANLLIVRTPLFIGYSLDDQDFRHVWQVISERLGSLRRSAFSVLVGASAPEIARFDRRGIKVINLPGKKNDYGLILGEVFREIRDYWTADLPKRSIVTRDKTAEELSLPVDARSSICFFAVSAERLAAYRSIVFPIAVEYGFTPVVSDDLISPGEPSSAKVASLLRRAEAVVVDTDDMWIRHELGANASVLVVDKAPKDETVMLYPPDWRSVARPRNYWTSDSFRCEVTKWFQTIGEHLATARKDEPTRLLTKHEYNAAVASAVSLLEVTLREALDRAGRFAIPLGQMLAWATELGLVTQAEWAEARLWQQLRNRAVHEGASIPRQQAAGVVGGAMALVDRIVQVGREVAAGHDEKVRAAEGAAGAP